MSDPRAQALAMARQALDHPDHPNTRQWKDLNSVEQQTAISVADAWIRSAIAAGLMPETANFFQVGVTYCGKYGWKFRAHEITTDPKDGTLMAVGERFWDGRWEPYTYWQEDWELHQSIGYYTGAETP